MPVAALQMELQEHPLCGPDGIIDVVGFAFLPGAAFVDGTGEVHAVLGERVPECLIRSRAHPGIPVFVGEDQQGPVNHPDFGIFGLRRRPFRARQQNQPPGEVFFYPFAHDLVVVRDLDFLVRRLAALPDQVGAERVQLQPERRVLLLVVFGLLGRFFQFAQPVRVLIFRRLQLSLERGNVILHRQLALRGVGEVRGMGQFQFGGENPRVRHEVKPRPIGPAGGRDPVGGVDQKRRVAPFSAQPFVIPEPDFVFEIAGMVRRGTVVEIDLRKIGPAGSIVNGPALADRVSQGKCRLKTDLRDNGISLDFVRQISGVDQIAGSSRRETPRIPVYGGNEGNCQQAEGRSEPRRGGPRHDLQKGVAGQDSYRRGDS